MKLIMIKFILMKSIFNKINFDEIHLDEIHFDEINFKHIFKPSLTILSLAQLSPSLFLTFTNKYKTGFKNRK